ncbi:surface protein, anchor region [Methanococcus vannielii SB]|uniref:Surface protein, anchor region n=1 Tax=Methanococcus vannielii (strain ATCC 35089 / DSM 1224 / JCM 13029 / OCM 148 / SB) TaxID=406327 RepID=A6UPJ5_METVS|nr:hypothetical protein [Methanococcus vannielii]ABR54417.1 surface protein, anchor region [Methanococcus vannielii SB]
MKKLFTLLLVVALVSSMSMASATGGIPQLPQNFYGGVYLNDLPASGTLKLLINGVEEDHVVVTNGVFGKGILDKKLTASGKSGDKITFSFQSSGYTINSAYTIYLVSSSKYVSDIDFQSGVNTEIVLKFNGTGSSDPGSSDPGSSDPGSSEQSMPLNPELFYGTAKLGDSNAFGTLKVYVDGVLQDSIVVQNGAFGGPGPLNTKLIATGYVGKTNEVKFSLESDGKTYNGFTAKVGDNTYTNKLPYVEATVCLIELKFSNSENTGNGDNSGTNPINGTNNSGMPLNPNIFYGTAKLGDSNAFGTLKVYVDGVLQDSIVVQNGAFGNSCVLADKLIATGYVGKTNEVKFSLESDGKTYNGFTAKVGDNTYTNKLPYVEATVCLIELKFSNSENTGNGDNSGTNPINGTNNSGMPLNPNIFYGIAYLGTSLPSSTLNVYVDGVLQDSIELKTGAFGGPGPLDDKLIATGYVGKTNEVKFSLESDGKTYNGFTAKVGDNTYTNKLPYVEGQHYIIITFTTSTESSDTGNGGSSGGNTGGGSSGGNTGGGNTGSSTVSGTTSTVSTSSTKTGSNMETSTKTSTSGSAVEPSDSETTPKTSVSEISTADDGSGEQSALLQQESSLTGLNLSLTVAAILLISIALIAGWYHSKAKPEVVHN